MTFGWVLTRRKILLAHHRLITSRLSVLFSTMFVLGALTVALIRPELRTTGLLATGLGIPFVAAALLVWDNARRRYRSLANRLRALDPAPPVSPR